MGYFNPLLRLPAARALMARPKEERVLLEQLFRELRAQADAEAERSWKKRKGPMAAYWRAVATYARHVAHALAKGLAPFESDGAAGAAPTTTKETVHA